MMQTIFISKMESLPPTSDIKMIDIWLILCQIYPFVEVVLLTAMEYRRADEDQKSDVFFLKSEEVNGDSVEPARSSFWKLAGIVTRMGAPDLKTLGLLRSCTTFVLFCCATL